MQHNQLFPILVLCLFTAANSPAAVRYVDHNSVNPMPPYANWATAATNIQDAVDAAVAGDQILVTNGVYQTGGRAVYGTMTNRVAVDKPVAVQSVNGPQLTIIQGYQVPGTTNGDGAIRCVHLTNGATLSGFTLTNGATRVDGEYPYEQYGGGVWCESTNALVTNCIISGNSAASVGGGVYGGLVTRCTLTGNSTSSGGGGAASATLNNCALIGNAAYYGGAAYGSVLNNCTVTGNSAGWNGGAVHSCTVNNCIVYYNSAPGDPDYVNYASSFPINYSCTTPPAVGLGVGNISAEPTLASASHLSAASPCRGAGSPDYVTGTDIDGEAWASPPSIGCDEYHAGSAGGPLTVSMTIAPTTAVTGSPATFPAFFPVALTASIEGQPDASIWDFGDGTILSNQPYASHSWKAPGEHAMVLRAYNESNPGGVSATVTVHVVEQFVYYVAANSSNPVTPYSSWATAATNIQDAVDAALGGSLVLVSNGIYRTGGRQVVSGNNRVMVDKPLTLRSVNGPEATLIEGGFGTRCVSLANGTFLAGFTLTNGNLRFQSSGGGVLFGDAPSDAVVSNCLITTCVGVVGGGGAPIRQVSGPPGSDGGTFVNCTFEKNQATGISFGFPFPPTLGGAVMGCRLTNCTLTGNSAGGPGAAAGGGANASILQNCILTSNSVVRGSGGGAAESLLINCLVTGNSADNAGGGTSSCSLSNCTLTANSAAKEGGGDFSSALNNCILYENTASSNANYSPGSTLNFSCTTPVPTNGVGNTTNAPLFVNPAGGDFRLQANSPCINAGNNDYVTSPVDIEGKERIVGGTVDMGAYEWIAVPTHYVSLTSPNPAPPYLSWSTAATNIQHAINAAVWGDQILVTNGVYQTGGTFVPSEVRGAARVLVPRGMRVESVNGPEVTIIVGYQVPGTTNGEGAVRCAYLEGDSMLTGFTLTNGATQLGHAGGGVYCDLRWGYPYPVVSNCVITGNAAGYGGGSYRGTLQNCTLTGNTVDFVGSSAMGGGAYGGTLNNCVLTGNRAYYGGGAAGLNSDLNDNCRLNNCTLVGNKAEYGGGAYGIVFLYECTVRGNSASQGGGIGYRCIGVNCLLTGNQASFLGGGAYEAGLTYCTVVGNTCPPSGIAGVFNTRLHNCIVYNNNSLFGATRNYAGSSVLLNYCCTTPLPESGIGNITNAPLFVDTNGWANLRLQSNSPCINAGLNGSTGSDLDSNPRLVGGTVDMGAYEFQSPISVLSYAWAQQYGLPTDGSADFSDSDSDRMNNWQEWIAGTVPTDAGSGLRLLNLSPGSTGTIVAWQSATNRTYFLESATNLGAAPVFSLVSRYIVGQAGTTSFTDTNATGPGPFFYRVGVQQ